jgi:hypothetical protein
MCFQGHFCHVFVRVVDVDTRPINPVLATNNNLSSRHYRRKCHGWKEARPDAIGLCVPMIAITVHYCDTSSRQHLKFEGRGKRAMSWDFYIHSFMQESGYHLR